MLLAAIYSWMHVTMLGVTLIPVFVAGYFQTEFTLPAISASQVVKLVIFPMGSNQVVYTSLPGSGFSQRQLVFDSKRFQGSECLSPAVLAHTYSVVRDHSFTWAVNACLITAGKQQGLGFLALPGEALLQILAKLPYGDVAQAGRVCKRLAHVTSDPSLWRQLFGQEFKKELPDGKVTFFVSLPLLGQQHVCNHVILVTGDSEMLHVREAVSIVVAMTIHLVYCNFSDVLGQWSHLQGGLYSSLFESEIFHAFCTLPSPLSPCCPYNRIRSYDTQFVTCRKYSQRSEPSLRRGTGYVRP